MKHQYYNEYMLKLTAMAVIRSMPSTELSDYWHSFNDDIDLNFYIDGNKLKVFVHDVVNGMIDTSDSFVIFEQTI